MLHTMNCVYYLQSDKLMYLVLLFEIRELERVENIVIKSEIVEKCDFSPRRVTDNIPYHENLSRYSQLTKFSNNFSVSNRLFCEFGIIPDKDWTFPKIVTITLDRLFLLSGLARSVELLQILS